MAIAATLLFAICATGQASAKPVATKVSIFSYPEGAFGYVDGGSAPARCAKAREVAVYRQVSDRRSAKRDRLLATVKTDKGPRAYQWSAPVPGGRVYARIAAAPGCGAASSATIRVGSLPGKVADDRGDYPECSAYVGEGSTYICRFPEMHVDLDQEAPFTSCSFSKNKGDCSGISLTGPTPWGVNVYGGRSKSKLFWNNHTVTYVSYREDQGSIGTSFISGTVPAANSAAFSVSDAFAQNDRGVEQGEHFYTPNIPGQAAGQPGGPLYFRFVAGKGDLGLAADVYISGYLYLRQ